jgi:hypothetical protein
MSDEKENLSPRIMSESRRSALSEYGGPGKCSPGSKADENGAEGWNNSPGVTSLS